MADMGFALKWTMGNEKLEKTSGGAYRVLGFGIPADFNFEGGNTCPAALVCRGVCYAKQGRYVMSSVRDARMHNLRSYLDHGSASFVALAIMDLQRLSTRYNVVRLHDSGDFFSQDYLDAWCEIASAFPDVIFYAYTKSLHLNHDNLPENLRITQSLGGRYDARLDLSRSHSRIFSSHDARKAAGYVDGNVSDLPAIEGTVRIGLVYHGSKNLTPAQENFFS